MSWSEVFRYDTLRGLVRRIKDNLDELSENPIG